MEEQWFNPNAVAPKLFPSDLFQIKIQIRENSLHVIELVTDKSQFIESGGVPSDSSELMKEIWADLEGYFSLGRIDHQKVWDKYQLAEAFPRTFTKQVMELTGAIPTGTVQQYGDLARTLGSRAYQAIGNCLRSNPYPILIPCHRVVRAKGVGGFMGKTDPNSKELQIKQKLIAFEQVRNTQNSNK